MTVDELRGWLKKRLGAGEGFDVLWQQLVDEHYISEFADPDNNYDKEEVLGTVRRKLQAARELVYAFGGGAPLGATNGQKNAPKDRPQDFFLDVDLDPQEVERARAYEEITAREAALNQGPDGSLPLAQWRSKVLGDRLLTLEDAHKVLESPAARFLPLPLFRHWEIPLVGHTVEELSYDSGEGKPYVDHRAIVKITPPGITKTIWYSNAPADGAPPDARWFHSKDAAGGMAILPSERVLRYKDRDGLKEEMWVWPGSLLDDLRFVGAHWARVLGWAEEEMIMWLLTGEPPGRPPLVPKVSYKMGYPTVTLTVHPWLSSDTVARNYRQIQHKLFGRENRPLRPKSVAVLRFVEKRTREEGGRPSWSRLLEEWNAQSSAEWRCTDRSNLSRIYRKAFEVVARQPVYLLGRKVSPAAAAKAKRKEDEALEQFKQSLERLVASGYETKNMTSTATSCRHLRVPL